MTEEERKGALIILRKTRGIDMDEVSYLIATLTKVDVEILVKLFDCKLARLEDEIQFVWIRYRMFMELVGNKYIDILFK